MFKKLTDICVSKKNSIDFIVQCQLKNLHPMNYKYRQTCFKAIFKIAYESGQSCKSCFY